MLVTTHESWLLCIAYLQIGGPKMLSHCNMSVQSHIVDGLVVFIYAYASLNSCGIFEFCSTNLISVYLNTVQ